MDLPFSDEEFFAVFAGYNRAVWPAQWLLHALALGAVAASFKGTRHSDRLSSVILSVLWLWMGVVYHFGFFTRINRAAYLFGALFILQALLLLRYGVWQDKLRFRPQFNTYGIAGWGAIVYALLIYPALGYVLGRRYPALPTFGLPCPTTIFTFGVLLWSGHHLPRLTLVIPLLWSVIGFMAALQLRVREDLGLLVFGLLSTALLLARKGRSAIAV